MRAAQHGVQESLTRCSRRRIRLPLIEKLDDSDVVRGGRSRTRQVLVVCQLPTVSTEEFTPYGCGQFVSRTNSTERIADCKGWERMWNVPRCWAMSICHNISTFKGLRLCTTMGSKLPRSSARNAFWHPFHHIPPIPFQPRSEVWLSY